MAKKTYDDVNRYDGKVESFNACEAYVACLERIKEEKEKLDGLKEKIEWLVFNEGSELGSSSLALVVEDTLWTRTETRRKKFLESQVIDTLTEMRNRTRAVGKRDLIDSLIVVTPSIDMAKVRRLKASFELPKEVLDVIDEAYEVGDPSVTLKHKLLEG